MQKFIKASYNENACCVEYVAENGDRLLRRGGTIAWRFNNPGNLRPGPKYKLHIGQGNTASGPFLIFPTPDDGRAEKKALLLRKYSNESISSMLYIYAPPQENDTERYIKNVCSKASLSRTQIIGNLSDDELKRMMAAMEEHEGYNHKADTRDEKWVRMTEIGFSDGARPISELAVKIKRGDQESIVKTNVYGQLKPLFHLEVGEKVDLWVENTEKSWTKLDTITLGDASRSHMFVCSRFEVQATTEQHNSLRVDKQKPYVIRYVVQPNDTLSKIATKFKVDAAKIQKDNGIKDPNRVLAGQVLIIGKGDRVNTITDAKKSALRSAPELSKESPSVAKTAMMARSKEGTGFPLALVSADQKRAPWMVVALEEAKHWAGKKENEITKTINYHKEIGQAGNLVSAPWCASFVNYCLKTAKYQHTGSAGSQSFTWNKAFSKIDSPIFGAIAVYRNPVAKHDKAGHKYYEGHVAFVYCRLKDGDLAVLGGNQGDSISFNPHTKVYLAQRPKGLGFELLGFYVPTAYRAFALEQIKAGGDLGPATYDLFQLRGLFKQSIHSSVTELQTR